MLGAGADAGNTEKLEQLGERAVAIGGEMAREVFGEGHGGKGGFAG